MLRLFLLGLLGLLFLYGSIFFFREFTGLGPVPTRSNFSGRLPKQPNGNFQFFYVTNRENTDETFSGRGNQLSSQIQRGIFDVQISPYLPTQPFVWFDSAYMKWKGHQELLHGAFHEQLQDAVQQSPKKSVLLVVWGFRDWFQSAALKTAYQAFLLDINTPVVLFDWPGNQGEGATGYRASQVVATLSAPALGRLIAEILQNTEVENLWIMGSSLGCQTICDALSWLYERPELVKKKNPINHVILAVPDVSTNAFDNKFAERIQALAKNLTAYVSSNDRALLMSQWLNRERRLGRLSQSMIPPERRTIPYEFEEAAELLDLQAKGFRNIQVVDATPINRLRNLHHFFTDSPEFFDDLYQRLLVPDNIVSRRLHEVRFSENRKYWILWNY